MTRKHKKKTGQGIRENVNTNHVNNRSAVRHIGPSSRICQINIEGVSRSKGEYLSKFLAEKNISVLLVQETHTESNEELNSRCQINGFDLVVAEHSRPHGIAIYVKQGSTDVHIVESNTMNNVYSSVIRIGALHITNVYKTVKLERNGSQHSVTPSDLFRRF